MALRHILYSLHLHIWQTLHLRFYPKLLTVHLSYTFYLSVLTWETIMRLALPVEPLEHVFPSDVQHTLMKAVTPRVSLCLLVKKQAHRRLFTTQELKQAKEWSRQAGCSLAPHPSVQWPGVQHTQRAGERWECVVSITAMSGDWVLEGTRWGRKALVNPRQPPENRYNLNINYINSSRSWIKKAVKHGRLGINYMSPCTHTHASIQTAFLPLHALFCSLFSASSFC